MLTPAHWGAVAGYLLLLLAIGLRLAGRQRDTHEFFLAGRRLAWPAVAMSMYASVTSAVTFMGVPALGATGDLAFVMVGPVSLLVAPWLALRWYPLYCEAGVTTTYEFLERRLGRSARRGAAAMFLAARVGWLGLVVYAPALAVASAAGIPLWWAVAGMGAIATAYTAMGGLAAVVWTDVVQFLVMVGGLVWVAAAVAARLPGGLATLAGEFARALPLSVADWRPDPVRLNALAVVLTYPWLLLHEYGADQVTAQRLLAVPEARGVRRAIFWNAVADTVLVTLLLAVGVGLGRLPWPGAETVPADARLAAFAVRALPPLAGGVLLAAIFAAAMSSMDSGLNSVVTVLIHDFLRPHWRCSELQWLRIARAATIGLGLCATAAALAVGRLGGLVRAYLTFTGLFGGPLLALFIHAMSRRAISVGWWGASAIVSVALGVAFRAGRVCNEIYLFPLGLAVCWIVPRAAAWLRRGCTASGSVRPGSG
ncbi:MAG: hypothetical protein N2652_09600 [Kiritimatiellae bacterium]|nr:hypothetical protein [Kiritimatiellia bacterium]